MSERKRYVGSFAAIMAVLLSCVASEAQLSSPGWRDGNAKRVDPGQLIAAPVVKDLDGGDAKSGGGGVSDEVSELARGLQYDPIRIFNYVHNHIEYTPYFGLLKGAGQTLLERSGNDFDQAALLVELLEESGYSPEYVYGTMHIPMLDVFYYDLPNWLITQVSSAAVETILANGGIPYAQSGQVSGYEVDRVWVEVDIGGQIHKLDPAFKRHYGQAGENVQNMLGYSRSTLLTQAGGQTGSGYVQNLSQTNVFTYLDGLTTNLLSALQGDHPNASVEEILGNYGIWSESVTNLPTSLRFISSTVTNWSSIPDQYCHEVSITHGDMAAATKKTCEIAGRRLSITYEEYGGAKAAGGGDEPKAVPVKAASVSLVKAVAITNGIVAVTPIAPTGLPTKFAQPIEKGLAKSGGGGVKSGNSITFDKVDPYGWNTDSESRSGSVQPGVTWTYLVGIAQGSSSAFYLTSGGGQYNATGYNFTVLFSGYNQTAGTKTGQVLVYYRPTYVTEGWYGVIEYDLSGEVAKEPETDFSSYDPIQTYYQEPDTDVLVFHNDGNEGLTINGNMTLSGGTPARFSFVSGHGAGTVSAAGTRNITWRFDAAQHGQFNTTLDFDFTYDDIDYELSDFWNVTLYGDAHYEPDLTTYDLTYGSQWYGIPVAGDCVLKNSGVVNLSITGISLVGADAGRFQVLSGGGTGTLTPGQQRNINVRYKADQVGSHAAAVRVNFTYDGWQFYYDLNLSGSTLSGDVATLWLDDDVLATETGPVSGPGVDLVIAIDHPYPAYTNTYADAEVTYPLKRGAVYTIIHGFGGTETGLPLEQRQRQLQAYREQGLGDDSRQIITESLNIVGQGWIEQTAMANKLINRLVGVRRVMHHRFGLMAQEQGYYVDVKAQFGAGGSTSGSIADSSAAFKAGGLIQSAMEHAILEQMQGSDKPGASTVKLLALANAGGDKIYLVDSNNFATVTNALTDYSAAELDAFSVFVEDGGLLVLPKDGSLTLNEWTGKGYIGHGPQGNSTTVIQMIISGDYGTQNGGYNSYTGNLNVQNVCTEAFVNLYEEAERNDRVSYDPVNLATGDLLFDRTDLALGGSGVRGLSFSRHYTSANHNQDGPLGYGWTHSYNIRVSEHTHYKAALGMRTPADAAPMMVAGLVTLDLLKNEQSAKGWVAASLVNQWATDRLTENAVSVHLGSRVLTYVEQPDGSYTPPPGVTTDLVVSNGLYRLQERFGTEYRFNADHRLSTIVDADGNTLSLSYNAQTNLQSVTDCYNRTLTLTYNGERITQVSDGTGRSVSYGYTGDDLTSYTDPDGHIWTYQYDGAHRLEALFDPTPQMTATNTFDSLGRVKLQRNGNGDEWDFRFTDFVNKEIDPEGGEKVYYFDAKRRETGQELVPGHRTTVVRDGQDQVTHFWDASGNLTRSYYDGEHNLTNRIDALGHQWTYEYDAANHLVAETDPLGNTTRYGYSVTHHLTNTVDALTNTTVLIYYTSGDHKGLPHTVTDPNGNVTTYTYNDYGAARTIARTDGGTVTNTWNVRGDLLVSRDANGNPTTSTYNNRRLVVTVADALNNTVSNTYNSAGLKTKVTDPLNRETVTTWTPTYQVDTITHPDNGVVRHHYDSCDLLVGITDARGNTVSNVYDSPQRKVATIVDPDGLAITTRFLHDPNGNIIAETNALGKATTFAYDPLDRLVMTTDPLGHSVSNTFDAAGRLVAVTDAKGYTTQYEFDDAGRKVADIKPDGVRESYTLDPNGNMTAFRNGLGETRTFAFDGMNRVTNETDAVGNSRDFVFDAAGNLLERHDADGAVIEYDYDALHRLVEIAYPDTGTVRYVYNELGLRTYQSNAVAEVWYGFDVMDRLSVVTQSVGAVQSVVEYSHDLNGNRTNVLYPGSVAVGYTFDDADRLTHVTDWGSRTTAYTYDDLHRKTGVNYPTAATGTWTWDDASRLTRVRYHNGTSNFVDRVYTLDAHGNTTAMEINAGLLPQVTPQVMRLKQNAADELTTIQTKANPGVQGWTDKTPVHDAEGNLTSDGDSTFSYDYENRLATVVSGAGSATYYYAGDGSRVAAVTIATGTTNTTIFVLDHADPLRRPLAELDGNGALIRRFVWGLGVIAQVEADGTVHYFHHDGQGSTLALSDTNNVPTDQWFYSPYGEVMSRAGTTETPYQWCGGMGLRPAVGNLYFARHRYYHAGLHRWIARDPAGMAGGANLYTYALNAPWLYYDPFGLCAEAWYQRDIIPGSSLQDMGMYASHGAHGLLRSPVDMVVGAFRGVQGIGSYFGHMSADASGTWDATVNTVQSLPQTVPTAVNNWANDPQAIGSTIGQIGIGFGVANALRPAQAASTAASTTPTLGQTALAGVGDDMLVHFSQTANRASIVRQGVTGGGGHSYFFRVGDVSGMTAGQARWAAGPISQAGANNSLAVIVSPEAAAFTRVSTSVPQYMTSQGSVPWTLIRSVAGGAP